MTTHANERTYAGESLTDRQAKRRLKFLAAGHELFGTIGFRATTVRLLCKQAELTDRYFYESFNSIEDLLADVYQRHTTHIQGEVFAAIVQSLSAQSVEYTIEQGLNAFFSAAECPKTARIVWLEVLGISPRIDALYAQVFQNFSQMFVQWSHSFFPQIQLSAEERKILANGMVGAVSQTTTVWCLSGYQQRRETLVQSISPIFIGLVLYARAAKREE